MIPVNFLNANELNLHNSTVHEKIKQFRCAICDAGFSRREELTKHRNKMHPETGALLVKDVIGKVFQNTCKSEKE